jgi:hypothetical protein
MLKKAAKQAKRRPVSARPQQDADREQLRAKINKRFSKSLEQLAR